MNFDFMVDGFVWSSLLLLLPLLIAPLFVGCSLFADAPSQAIPPSVVLEVIPVLTQVRIRDFAANSSLEIQNQIQELLPHDRSIQPDSVEARPGPDVRNVEVSMLVNVEYQGPGDVPQRVNNSYDAVVRFVPQVVSTAAGVITIDWQVDIGGLNPDNRRLMVTLPDTGGEPLLGSIHIAINGSIITTNLPPIPFLQAIGSYPTPVDQTGIYTAFFTVSNAQANLLTPSDTDLYQA